VLDLAMGTLSDTGAKALLASPAIKRLRKLDIHHHFVTPDIVTALSTLNIEIDASDPTEPDEWGGETHRFIAVGA
jgi:hypothetical protein